MSSRQLALIAAILVAGCATSTQPSPPAISSAAGDTRHAGEYRRCSATDPDRFAWFCQIGQLLYDNITNLLTNRLR